MYRSVLNLAVVLALTLSGCGGGYSTWDTGESGSLAQSCGAPDANYFSVRITGPLIAPYNFQEEGWDWDGDISSWYDDYGLYVEMLALIATQGEYEWGSFGELVDELSGTLGPWEVTPEWGGEGPVCSAKGL